VIVSENPNSDISFVWQSESGGLLRGTATGLDRAVLAHLPQSYDQVGNQLQVLWDHALAWARRIAQRRGDDNRTAEHEER
jgi:hypothetical protein